MLSTPMDWIVIEVIILYVSTMVYTIIIWLDESGNTSLNQLEIFKNTTKEVVPFFYFALIFVVGTFEIIGEIMLRYTIKMQEAHAKGKAEGIQEGKTEGKAEGIQEGKAEGIQEGKAEGIQEGREEILREWHADWERRKQAAIEKGIPFDEPPPPAPNNTHHKE